MKDESLAMSLLKDYKNSNERMFKIIITLIICILHSPQLDNYKH